MFGWRRRKAAPAGVDIGSSRVKVVELIFKGDTVTLAGMGREMLMPESIVDGQILDREGVANAIVKAFEGGGIKAEQTVAAVSGYSSILKRILLPPMSPEELSESIDWHAEEHIPFDIADVMLDYQVIESSAEKLVVQIAACKREVVTNLKETLEKARKQTLIVDVEELALQNCYLFNYEPVKDSMVALLDIGASQSVMSIMEGNQADFTRAISFGGDEYTRSLQEELGLTFEQAEQTKRSTQRELEIKGVEIEGVVESLSKMLSVKALINSVSENLAKEIRKTFDFHRSVSQYEGHEIEKILLSGGASKLDDLAEFLSNKLEMPVERLEPFRRITYNEQQFTNEQLSDVGPEMAVAVGLALRGAPEPIAATINLLKHDEERSPPVEIDSGKPKRKYRFKGRNQLGDVVVGERLAESRAALREILRREEITLVSDRNVFTLLAAMVASLRRKRVSPRELERFTRRFNFLITAGSPLVQSFYLLADAENNLHFRQVLRSVASNLDTGSTLTSAIANHPDVFDRYYVQMMEAGETGGVLDISLSRVLSRLEELSKWRRNLKLALLYPLTTVALLLLAAVSLVLRSKVIAAQLPARPVVFIGLILIAAAGAAVAAIIVFYKTERGRERLDTLLLRAPLLGEFCRKAAVARFARIFCSLLSSGNPILDSMDITAEDAKNVVVRNAINNARYGVECGQSFHETMTDADVFSQLDRTMMGIGEQVGALDSSLCKLAEFYELELNETLARLPLLFVPVLIVLLALIIGLVFVYR